MTLALDYCEHCTSGQETIASFVAVRSRGFVGGDVDAGVFQEVDGAF
jgi:hypothetical protein